MPEVAPGAVRSARKRTSRNRIPDAWGSGFVSYTLARTADGGFSVTTCNDKAGVDESVLKRAKDWIAENAGSIGASAPAISSKGTVILHVK
ncbi:hypothetical protein ACTMU2_07660 [Cupriavidus basilensis]